VRPSSCCTSQDSNRRCTIFPTITWTLSNLTEKRQSSATAVSGCKHLAMVPRSSSLRATRKLDRTSSKRRHILQEKWNKPMKQAAQRFQPFQSTFSSALFQFEKFLRLRPALCHYPQDSTSARICSATSFTGISGIWLLQNTSCRRWKTGILNDFQLSMSSPKSLETILFRLKLC